MWTKAEYSKVIEAMEAVGGIVGTLQTLETLTERDVEYNKEVVKSLKGIVKAVIEDMEKSTDSPEG